MDQNPVRPTIPTATALPAVRRIGASDLVDALRLGLDDFRAMPTHAVFLAVIYPIVGLVIGRAALGYDIVPLIYPLAAGFALLGPFAAIGLYELSRRRQEGGTPEWTDALDVVHAPAFGAILTLGLLLCVVFAVWVAVARAIYIADFGYGEPDSLSAFARQVLSTPEGRHLILAGNGVGLLFAIAVLTISAVSFPLLLDRGGSAMAAMLTSVRVVLKNPVTMALWGVIVACGLLVGALPALLGLAVVLPVLGHATWHLYGKAVEPHRGPRPLRRRRSEEGRYAADFPVVLVPWARERRR